MTDKTCSQPGCPVATSGKCLEGFDPPDTCPHLGAQPDEGAGRVGESLDLVDLPSGQALTEDEAADITRNGRTQVVVVAGPIGSGKTTILTALYEAFLDAPISDFQFRGSRTLIGFERRCHDGREESRRVMPETPHTSMREGVVFLHLELVSPEQGRDAAQHLLVTDVSGELFEKIRDSREAAEKLACLRRTDHLCLALDGEAMMSPATRQVVRNDCRSILRSILEAGVLTASCTIDVAITKWDKVVEATAPDKAARSFIDETATLLSETARGKEVRFFEVAARPTSRVLPFAHGVPTLLRAWLRESTRDTAKPSEQLGDHSREMARFTAAYAASRRSEVADA